MQQQTGVPPIITQQQQPAFMQPMMQSQHAWIMSQQALSPLVQVMQQPLAVISHLHIAIIMLQLQTTIPFIVQQTLHIPPAIIAQRFCIIVQAAGSSQVQVIFIPPAHFSTFIAHFGTITMFGDIPVGIGIPVVPVLGVALIGFIIAVIMFGSQFGVITAGDDNPVWAVCNCDHFGRRLCFFPFASASRGVLGIHRLAKRGSKLLAQRRFPSFRRTIWRHAPSRLWPAESASRLLGFPAPSLLT